MEFDKIFVSNYLSQEKYPYGLLAAIGVISLCFIFSLFYWDSDQAFSSLLAANPEAVFEKNEYWRVFTSVFVHSSMEHLLSNSMMLFILTYFVTAFFGFWVSPVLSFVAGGIINLLVLATFERNITLVGASGVVYYLWGYWLILFLLIERQISWPRRLVKVVGLFLILLVPTTYAPSTSYLAHYTGFVLGILSGGVAYPILRQKIIRHEKWRLEVVPDFEQTEDSN